MATSYTPLEPNLTKELTGVDVGFNTSATPSFFASTSFIYTLAFVVIIAAASFRYAYAGMLRINPSEANIKKSKEEFTRVTYGLLGVLGLWLVLFTVNKDMLTGDVTLANLRAEVGGGSTNTGTVKESEVTLGDDGKPITTNTNGSETDNRALFKTKDIQINKSACVGSNTSCTNVASMPDTTIQMLISLRSKCSGTITITGGTEPGHSSHGSGLTPVDISIYDNSVNTCIRSFAQGPSKSFCNATYTNFGYIFCDEKGTPHWHVYKG